MVLHNYYGKDYCNPSRRSKQSLSQEKQGANTCTVHIIYGPVYACTRGKIRVPVSVTTGPSIPVMAQFYHGNYCIRIVYNVEDVTMCTRICDRG